jgi:glycine cleavage system H protein
MPEYKFAKSHEWIAKFDDTYRMGISDFAQSQLGDITFVEFPNLGAKFAMGDSISSIESVKAVSEYYAPLDIEVVAVNNALENQPELVNIDPMGKGYILEVVLLDESQLEHLMDSSTYEALDKEGH